jgi:phage-related protein
MPSIGPDCHELRVNDASKAWHIVHCIKPDAIVIVDVFEKKTQTTPKTIVENCKRRMRLYES